MVATTIDRARAVRTGRQLNRSTTDDLWALVFIGPQVIGLLVFSALPLMSAFYLSLTNLGRLRQPDVPRIEQLRRATTSLLDILKETDPRVGITRHFTSCACMDSELTPDWSA
jgi:ABC-type sugar transport system permease subunit